MRKHIRCAVPLRWTFEPRRPEYLRLRHSLAVVDDRRRVLRPLVLAAAVRTDDLADKVRDHGKGRAIDFYAGVDQFSGRLARREYFWHWRAIPPTPRHRMWKAVSPSIKFDTAAVAACVR